MPKKLLFILCSFTLIINCFCQTYFYKLGFTRNQNIIVKNNITPVEFPWVGGMNSVRFSAIDINIDGKLDFIAFEKHGNRILPFVQTIENKEAVWKYAPEFAHKFPDLHDWVILKDYNNDNKPDIFTYGLGGIRVFQNNSTTHLSFKLITNALQSLYYGNPVNIFASPDDYLGIADVNGDGKLDILNFWVLGKFVHYQKNISTNYDSFLFDLADECWGKFSEAADNNEITLFTNCNKKHQSENEKHIGSSIDVFDVDGNGLQDIIIGDVDYGNMILLLNEGTANDALMTSQTKNFPNSTFPIDLVSMPTISRLDINFDGKDELLVSPSDPSFSKSEDKNSVWCYEYNEQLTDYQLTTKSFFQEEIIDVGSGALPVLFDWNNDGLIDFFVSNYGCFDDNYKSSISYYKNIGTINAPEFELITNDFGDLKKYGFTALFPTFADLNGNGAVDLLCGNSDGTLLFFNNTALPYLMPQFQTPVINYQNINVSAFSTPQLFDLDKDGVSELIIGNRRGLLSFYKNVGTHQNPNFQLITNNFGNVDVRDDEQSYFGYSVPCFFRANNETMLACGSEQGVIFLYNNIDQNLSGNFSFLHKLVENVQNEPILLRVGARVGAAIADLTNDSKPELIVGNWAGGVSFFQGSVPLEITISENTNTQTCTVFPNPFQNEINIESTSQIIKFELIDLIGNMILEYSNLQILESTSIHLNVSTNKLKKGVYFLQIHTLNSVEVKKLIKL